MTSTDLSRYAGDAVLRDGRTIHIRPIRPDDTQRMLEMWERLSPETIRMRFFSPLGMDEERMRHFTHLDMRRRFALVAEVAGRIVGVGRFDRYEQDPGKAEFAVLVEDAEQKRGIGTALLRWLARPAEDLGVSEFTGDILRENDRMLRMMRDAGIEQRVTYEGPVVQTSFATVATERYLEAFDEQDRHAAVAALSAVLRPAGIAVVGASRDPGKVGGRIFANLLDCGFNGPIYPVNPAADVVQSVAAYPTVADCPTVPPLVVVCVPAGSAGKAVDEAAAAGAKVAVIVSSGFADGGDEGEARQRRLMRAVRSHGMRVVGPNCMGVLNTSDAVRMNATFSTVFPARGNVAFSSQSGALGLAVLGAARRLGVGLSSFASLGNKADVSSNDLLQYWEADEDTDVVLLYLESFGNPRKFGRIARRIARTKPIVAVAPGRASAGGRTASGYTGAPAAGDVAVGGLFRQAGVIRVETLDELFDVAAVLANQPVPRNDRVAVLANGGGPGLLAADACESTGLRVPELDAATTERLHGCLPPTAGTGNPVDMTASASAPDYGRAMRALAADANVDSLLVIFVSPTLTRAEDVAEQVVAVDEELGDSLTVVGVFMSEQDVPQSLRRAGVPAFRFPEGAAKALGHAARYGLWRTRPLGNVVRVADADAEAARTVIDEALADGRRDAWLDAGQTGRLLRSYGITAAAARVVRDPEQAAQAQRELDGPVAVKTAAPVRKTELGGVRLDLRSPEEATEAGRAVLDDLRRRGVADAAEQGLLVQRMVTDGVEMAVGLSHDPTFGHVLVVSLGGTLVELLADVSVRIHPLTDVDVEDMLTSLRGHPLLTGFRGSPPADRDALKELLFRVSAMVDAVPEIAELDFNPVFVRAEGVATVDARVRVSREHRAPRT